MKNIIILIAIFFPFIVSAQLLTDGTTARSHPITKELSFLVLLVIVAFFLIYFSKKINHLKLRNIIIVLLGLIIIAASLLILFGVFLFGV
jgi:hypothetical protein